MFLKEWDEEAINIVRKMSPKEKDRLNAIIAMHTLVCDMNDETAYMTWVYLVPDGASEYDFIEFAVNDEGSEENQSFDEAVELFKRVWTRYAAKEKGLYIGGKTY